MVNPTPIRSKHKQSLVMQRLETAMLWFAFLVLKLISFLPLPILHFFGSLIGKLLYRKESKRKNIAMKNIQLCFPEKSPAEQQQLLKDHFIALGKSGFDFAIAFCANDRRFEKLIELRDVEYLDQAVQSDRPVVILVPHFMSIAIGALYISTRYPVLSMYKRLKNPFLHKVYQKICLKESTNFFLDDFIINTKRDGLMELVEHRQGFKRIITAFKNKMVFYYLPDQNLGRRNTVFAPFFGNHAATVNILGRLVKLTNAVVIPCAPTQKDNAKGYQIRFYKPLSEPQGDDLDYATKMNQAIEQIIKEFPAQYFWLHRRFSSRPEGEEKFY